MYGSIIKILYSEIIIATETILCRLTLWKIGDVKCCTKIRQQIEIL